MELNHRVEHTLLSAQADEKQIKKLCQEAVDHDFRGVCVPPFYVKSARTHLEPTDKKVITVVDFPMGFSHTISKTESIRKAADQGAHGVDVVINYTAAINGSWPLAEDDIQTVVHKARMSDLEIKLIIELGAYPSKTLKRIVQICKNAQPDYVKTNTGMMGQVVEMDQLKLLVRLLDGELPIKASGGIRSAEAAQKLIDAGAQLIGASSAVNW